MLQADIVHPSGMMDTDRDAWRRFCAATPQFRGPLLGPEFTDIVGQWRDDACVAVFRLGGRAVGFLPHHRRPSGFGRPIGSPFSDYHALVSEPGVRLHGREALRAAGLNAFRFSGLIDPFGLFADVPQDDDKGYVMRFGAGGAQPFLDWLRQTNPKRFKNYRRLEHKLERECGEIDVCAPDTSREAFEQLVDWKRAQLHRTGLHDFLRPDWALGMMRALFERRDGPLQGLMLTVRAGGRLISGHFGVRQNGIFHSWLASMDPGAGAWSPGQTLLFQAIPVAPAIGIDRYDLGPSHAHYKGPFCNEFAPIGRGLALAETPGGRMAGSVDGVLSRAALRSAAVARLLRRMDQIAAVELSVGGRMRGVVEAFVGQARRAREGQDEPVSGD